LGGVRPFDNRFLRILKAIGCEIEIIGKPQRIGDVMAYAAIWETDFRGTETRGRIRGQGATKPLKWPPQTSL
jgi:N-acyl-L-homoserine lactone synthetase